MVELNEELEEALAVYEDAKARLAQTAKRVQNECKHEIVAQEATKSMQYGSPLSPTIICLSCRKEFETKAYYDWYSFGKKTHHCPANVKLVLETGQVPVHNIYQLRLP